jgi:hypothetical protein
MRHARPARRRRDSAAPACTARRHNAGRSPGCGPGLRWRNHEPYRSYPNQASRTPSLSAALPSASAISHRGPERLPDITTGETTTTRVYGPGTVPACCNWVATGTRWSRYGARSMARAICPVIAVGTVRSATSTWCVVSQPTTGVPSMRAVPGARVNRAAATSAARRATLLATSSAYGDAPPLRPEPSRSAGTCALAADQPQSLSMLTGTRRVHEPPCSMARYSRAATRIRSHNVIRRLAVKRPDRRIGARGL